MIVEELAAGSGEEPGLSAKGRKLRGARWVADIPGLKYRSKRSLAERTYTSPG